MAKACGATGGIKWGMAATPSHGFIAIDDAVGGGVRGGELVERMLLHLMLLLMMNRSQREQLHHSFNR